MAIGLPGFNLYGIFYSMRIIYFSVVSLFIFQDLFSEKILPITLEYAITTEERAWGLMQRRELPKNHGMLFVYPRNQRLSVWMFNCFIDLSISFLDGNGVITEIRELKSYPEKMDPARPVSKLRDFNKYPPNDPIVEFFHRNQVTSSTPAHFALEMGSDWFKENEIKIGDRLKWESGSPTAYIIQK
jgi:uncharacterized membrane protein (UPF0127 family)